MRLTWTEAKRKSNIKAHGLDFLDVSKVFEGLTFTFEDDRYIYSEQRFVTLGLLNGIPVSIVHTETADRIHVISFRKATKNEQIILFQNLQD
ncbi:MAG: BrnT family toxin [Gammaproteobacteria bacterium]|nr:BrnT family toxin [Gammaproteobacteria bacterium]